MVSQAQSKLANWKEKALSLTSVIPAHDAVMQECLRLLEHLTHHFGVMVKLLSPILKQKHLRAICEGQNPLRCVMSSSITSISTHGILQALVYSMNQRRRLLVRCYPSISKMTMTLLMR